MEGVVFGGRIDVIELVLRRVDLVGCLLSTVTSDIAGEDKTILDCKDSQQMSA